MRTRALCFTALLLTLAACSSVKTGPPSEEGALRKEFVAKHPQPSAQVACRREDGSGITEISIERTPCFGFCSTYTLHLFADGRVEYSGQSAMQRIGAHHGTLDPYYFKSLADDAAGIGFFSMEDSYSCMVTDQPTVYVAVTRNGERKIIQHYAVDHTGPAALRLFEEKIDSMMKLVKWAKK